MSFIQGHYGKSIPLSAENLSLNGGKSVLEWRKICP